MGTLKLFLRYIAIFIITAAVLISSLLLVSLIPREKIQKNMEKSAAYLQQKGAAFPFTVIGVGCSHADYYADAVLLNVAFYFEREHPAESVSWAHFYSEDKYDWNGMVTDYLSFAVKNQPEPNQQYLRYWHGSLVIVRPLLIWLSISAIYKLLGGLLWILLGSIVILLIRKGFRKEAVAFILAMIAVSVWFVPVCLEYTWMFLVMAITTLIVIRFSLKQEFDKMPGLFLCVGMITVFLDFFTTETITLLIPLLFMSAIRHKQNSDPPHWISVVHCSALWGTGYIAMWMTKWIFATVVLKQDVMPFVRNSITEHLGTDNRLSLVQLWCKSIRNNIHTLSTLNYGMIGAALTILLFFCLIFLPVVLNKITLKKHIQKEWGMLYLLIGMIPYLRFIVLSGHSAVHSCFTYRAQAASIMAFIFAFYELVDFNFKRKRIGEK